MPDAPAVSAQRRLMYRIIFEADTSAGKAFDVVLLAAIVLSVLAVLLESVEPFRESWPRLLQGAEWCFTVLFTVEYVLRLYCVRRRLGYALSFFGLVDLLAVLPTYLSLFIPGAQSLLVIRALRLLRVFRVFKLARYLSEADALRLALWQSRAKIAVFLCTIVVVVTIMAAAMYLVEGRVGNAGFDSIPDAMYWAVVTMTTLGYGDVVPETSIGKALTAIVVVIGYSLIIVPTGIITAELARPSGKPITTRVCSHCAREGHDADAVYCKFCGATMPRRRRR